MVLPARRGSVPVTITLKNVLIRFSCVFLKWLHVVLTRFHRNLFVQKKTFPMTN